MFSGIVADIGKITQVQDREGGLRLIILSNTMSMDDVRPGDSIAVNGVCLTVVALDEKYFTADVSRETLNSTTGLTTSGAHVNLEKSLRLADRLGGHLVSGHVDGVGEVLAFTDLGESWRLTVNAPPALAKYVATKGSITVNGVSLTVNDVTETIFNVNLIPHTLSATTLRELHAGSKVNLEIDLIARYIERLLQNGVQEKI